VEAADTGPLADADPLRMDVFVEVDYMEGEKPDERALEMVEEAYADAPVSNSDGSTGISLHLSLDEAVPASAPTDSSALDRLMGAHFDHEDTGYRYGLAVERARLDGNEVGGFAGGSNGQFTFETAYDSGGEWPTSYTAGVVMHELGHSVGIDDDDYRGVDSEAVAYDKYTSQMNYNGPYDSLVYNDGPPFDDWAHIVGNFFTPYVDEDELPTPGDED
jgi:hypothetical protein